MTTLPGTFAVPTFGTPVALRGTSRPEGPAPSAPTDGLYDPRFEHDACGIALVADLHGRPSHSLVRRAITALEHLAHRGATGSEEDSGDGAGILLQVPHSFYREVVEFDLPEAGHYATGIAFLSRDPSEAAKARIGIEQLADEEGLGVLGWREVPFNDATLGSVARGDMPSIHQVFVVPAPGAVLAGDDIPLAIDRLTFVLRKRAEHHIDDCYFASLSARTVNYKGMLTSHQLAEFYPDLSDPRVESGLALVHSRFSTNTFPSWMLAHPYRYLAHNGEINTLAGNRNWMRAREALCSTDLIPGLDRAFPILTNGASDSASFDEVLELLHLGGRPLHHAVLMMIPEAWENHRAMDPARRAFYRYHSSLMEPWDGPAAVAFTDGCVIGAVLDRNGLRPARYWVTDDGLVVLASEVGVLDVPSSKVVRKGRLQPGRMFLVDTVAGKIIDDEEIKSALADEQPYAKWLEEGQIDLDDLPPKTMLTPQHASVIGRQRVFGYTNEELRLIIGPMAKSGAEPIGSMGTDAAIAVLSDRPRLLYDYFTQLFAQVTNPPLDAIREELVTSLASTLGPESNLLEPTAASCQQIVLPMPVIDNDDLAKLLYINEDGQTPGYRAFAVDGLFEVARGGAGLKDAIEDVRFRVSVAIAEGADIIVLSDRNSTRDYAPIPSLLMVSAVHHHLVREKTRTRVGLVIESGDAREVHHMALLKGFGAAAINPYLAFETIDDMIASGLLTGVTPRQAQRNYIKAASKGIVKVMSKMGISTVASYTGAQAFEAVGLAHDVIDEYFTGTVSRIGGVGLEVLAEEVAARHRLLHLDRPTELAHRDREGGGEYQWRREGEVHLFTPKTVFKLQHATRSKRYEVFKEYTKAVDDQSNKLATLRGLLRLKADAGTAIPIEEVEPISAILKRFSTGAMSYGSISAEAHETLAIAMNRLGGRSNTGEGGEDAERFTPDANGDLRRSAIKQVASGRFGVTSEYLVNADDIQIKIAQGAKPGEGGQLPGHKVYPWIAKTRFSTPGVGLISPPPHHDIYSIEDIAQLIHDLKSANPRARIHVKLVAEVGVGTVAAGVAKA
ncbi:MAG TPA: glutamate synthase large subunit, partial [Acidimicrobiales bacterium]|nr:glutamate synthase large subunit [Acidimicrobiales bacterium]